MQLSLRFCFYEIQKRHPEATLSKITARELAFSSVGVLVAQERCIEETLYFDLLSNEASGFFKNMTVVCKPSRAIHFAYCTVITVPEDTNILRLFDDMLLVFSRFARWRDEIEREVASRCDLDVVLAITRRMELNPIWIANNDLKMVACRDAGSYALTSPEWNFAERFGYLPYQTAEKLVETGEIDTIQAQQPAIIMHNTQCFQNAYATKAIYHQKRHYGNVFIIQYFDVLNEHDREIAEQLGQMLAYSPFTRRNYTKDYPLGFVFIEELLSGEKMDPKIVEQQARLLGWDADDLLLVTVSMLGELSDLGDLDDHGANESTSVGTSVGTSIGTSEIPTLNSTCSLLQANGFAQSLVFEGSVVTILRGRPAELARMEAKVRRIVSLDGYCMGVSERFSDLTHFLAHYRQARYAAMAGMNGMTGAAGTTGMEDGMGEEGAMGVSYDKVFVRHIAQELQETLPPFDPVEALRAFDEQTSSCLCETLETWIACNGNMSHTAKKLHVHRNTVIARIDKIRTLTDIDLESFDMRIRLYLELHRRGGL